MKKILIGLMRNVIRACAKRGENPDEIYLEALKEAL